MAFFGRGVFTAVEFGTSKVCALHGGCDKAGNPVVLGFGRCDSDGAVCKGDIIDYSAATNALAKALEDADKSAGHNFDRRNVYCLVSGQGISSRQGEGNVAIYDEDRKIKSAHIKEAVMKAQSLSLSPEQIHIATFDSYFMVDTRHRVKDPLDQAASRLDAFVHIIFAERNRVETMRSILRELGFENHASCVFSGVASAYGALTQDDREQGVLLIDMGAGCSDYIVVRDEGILLSGTVPIGTDNIANDLSIGLDLSLEQCRKFIAESKLEEYQRNGSGFIEMNVRDSKRRKIPMASFEKIIDMRLRETFSIIKEKVEMKSLGPLLGNGVVFCGGAAMMPAAMESLRDVSGMHVRRGESTGISGAMNGLDIPARYTSILGLLKYAVELENGSDSPAHLGKVGDALEGFTDGIVRRFKDVKKAFKI